MARLYAATGDAIVRLDEASGDWRVQIFLRGSGAQCLAVDPSDPDTLYAGLRERGVQRTGDGGLTWVDCALPERGVFSLAVSPADSAVYAGTEPSRLFRSDDRGESWRELEGLLELPSRPAWSFPPRPWTSHVRWIAPCPHDGDLILVGIELGGLMRSSDGGTTWQDHRPGAQRDVHSLAWHPIADGRAYEAGGGGAAFSVDAGESWQPADEGRDRHYTWSVAVDPDDPEHLSAARGRALARPRRRAPRTATGNAVCAGCRRRPPLRGAGRRSGLGEPRPRRQLARLHPSRRLHLGSRRARLRERLSARDHTGRFWAVDAAVTSH